MRIVHLSDIHFWQYDVQPASAPEQAPAGDDLAPAAAGRAGFGSNGCPSWWSACNSLEPDHILITGDLTTTALPAEFRAARAALADWLGDPARVTIIPGNHDRYTLLRPSLPPLRAILRRVFSRAVVPVAARLDAETAILGLDPTRSGISASGKLPRSPDRSARERLLAACRTDRAPR